MVALPLSLVASVKSWKLNLRGSWELMKSIQKDGGAIYWLLAAYRNSESGDRYSPGHHNAPTFLFGTKAFVNLILGQEEKARSLIFDNLLAKDWRTTCATPESCLAAADQGDGTGTEGQVAAALTLGLMRDKNGVFEDTALALELLEDCDRGTTCAHTSILAPFKVIGAKLSVAEFYGKVGDLDNMNRLYEEAAALAYEDGVDGELWPESYRNRIQRAKHDFLKEGGVLEQWKIGGDVVGEIMFPTPPSQRSGACAGCHFGARMSEPDIYFGFRRGEP